MAHGVNTLL